MGGPTVPAGTTIKVTLDGALTAGDIDPRAFAEEPAATGGNEPRTAVATAEPIGAGAALALGGALAVALAGVFVWSTRNAGSKQMRQSLATEKSVLLQQLAALDDQHARGELDDTSWTTERARLKRQLLTVARALEDTK